MDSMIQANRHGHIACTQGGECLAGAKRAFELGLVSAEEALVLDATAHHLKFIGFQEMYFENTFPAEFGVTPKPELANRPELIITQAEKAALAEQDYVVKAANNVVSRLGLAKK
jgi:threonine synthase